MQFGIMDIESSKNSSIGEQLQRTICRQILAVMGHPILFYLFLLSSPPPG